MKDKFFNLTHEKQQLILAAAIKEFALLGYDKASTDQIASSAGISKGSLFNYFTNKLNLYLYILEYAITKINEEAIEEIKKIEDIDFYDRLKKISLIKHQVCFKYPDETRIVTAFFINPPKSINAPFEKFKKYYEMDINILKNYLIKYLDISLLREGITIEDVLFITTALFEALIKRNIEMTTIKSNDQQGSANEKIIDFDKYIEVLKHGLYKH